MSNQVHPPLPFLLFVKHVRRSKLIKKIEVCALIQAYYYMHMLCVWWLQLYANYAIGKDVEAMKAVVGEEALSLEAYIVISALSPILVTISTELPFLDFVAVYILY